ncbi:MAG: hypothetical protein Q7J24_06075 [Desulfomicrobium sp.]|nr:hypothetical protein [Desulfomicrobium sp.]
MVAASSLRRRLRRLPGDKPAPSFWLVSIMPDGTEHDHHTLEPWPTQAYLNRDQRAPEMVLKLTMGGQV